MGCKLNGKALEEIIMKLFQVDEECIVHSQGLGSFISSNNNLDAKNKNYIGYGILNKEVLPNSLVSCSKKKMGVKLSIVLSFTGPDSEKLVDKVLSWKESSNVKEVFERYQSEIQNIDCAISTMSEDFGITWHIKIFVSSVLEIED